MNTILLVLLPYGPSAEDFVVSFYPEIFGVLYKIKVALRKGKTMVSGRKPAAWGCAGPWTCTELKASLESAAPGAQLDRPELAGPSGAPQGMSCKKTSSCIFESLKRVLYFIHRALSAEYPRTEPLRFSLPPNFETNFSRLEDTVART